MAEDDLGPMADVDSLESETLDGWTILEQLLLASAINRHGVGDWDAVCSEMASRAQFISTRPPEYFTPQVDQAAFLEHLRIKSVARLRAELALEEAYIRAEKEKLKSLREQQQREQTQQEEPAATCPPAGGPAGGDTGRPEPSPGARVGEASTSGRTPDEALEPKVQNTAYSEPQSGPAPVPNSADIGQAPSLKSDEPLTTTVAPSPATLPEAIDLLESGQGGAQAGGTIPVQLDELVASAADVRMLDSGLAPAAAAEPLGTAGGAQALEASEAPGGQGGGTEEVQGGAGGALQCMGGPGEGGEGGSAAGTPEVLGEGAGPGLGGREEGGFAGAPSGESLVREGLAKPAPASNLEQESGRSAEAMPAASGGGTEEEEQARNAPGEILPQGEDGPSHPLLGLLAPSSSRASTSQGGAEPVAEGSGGHAAAAGLGSAQEARTVGLGTSSDQGEAVSVQDTGWPGGRHKPECKSQDLSPNPNLHPNPSPSSSPALRDHPVNPSPTGVLDSRTDTRTAAPAGEGPAHDKGQTADAAAAEGDAQGRLPGGSPALDGHGKSSHGGTSSSAEAGTDAAVPGVDTRGNDLLVFEGRDALGGSSCVAPLGSGAALCGLGSESQGDGEPSLALKGDSKFAADGLTQGPVRGLGGVGFEGLEPQPAERRVLEEASAQELVQASAHCHMPDDTPAGVAAEVPLCQDLAALGIHRPSAAHAVSAGGNGRQLAAAGLLNPSAEGSGQEPPLEELGGFQERGGSRDEGRGKEGGVKEEGRKAPAGAGAIDLLRQAYDDNTSVGSMLSSPTGMPSVTSSPACRLLQSISAPPPFVAPLSEATCLSAGLAPPGLESGSGLDAGSDPDLSQRAASLGERPKDAANELQALTPTVGQGVGGGGRGGALADGTRVAKIEPPGLSGPLDANLGSPAGEMAEGNVSRPPLLTRPSLAGALEAAGAEGVEAKVTFPSVKHPVASAALADERALLGQVASPGARGALSGGAERGAEDTLVWAGRGGVEEGEALRNEELTAGMRGGVGGEGQESIGRALYEHDVALGEPLLQVGHLSRGGAQRAGGLAAAVVSQEGSLVKPAEMGDGKNVDDNNVQGAGAEAEAGGGDDLEVMDGSAHVGMFLGADVATPGANSSSPLLAPVLTGQVSDEHAAAGAPCDGGEVKPAELVQACVGGGLAEGGEAGNVIQGVAELGGDAANSRAHEAKGKRGAEAGGAGGGGGGGRDEGGAGGTSGDRGTELLPGAGSGEEVGKEAGASLEDAERRSPRKAGTLQHPSAGIGVLAGLGEGESEAVLQERGPGGKGDSRGEAPTAGAGDSLKEGFAGFWDSGPGDEGWGGAGEQGRPAMQGGHILYSRRKKRERKQQLEAAQQAGSSPGALGCEDGAAGAGGEDVVDGLASAAPGKDSSGAGGGGSGGGGGGVRRKRLLLVEEEDDEAGAPPQKLLRLELDEDEAGEEGRSLVGDSHLGAERGHAGGADTTPAVAVPAASAVAAAVMEASSRLVLGSKLGWEGNDEEEEEEEEDGGDGDEARGDGPAENDDSQSLIGTASKAASGTRGGGESQRSSVGRGPPGGGLSLGRYQEYADSRAMDPESPLDSKEDMSPTSRRSKKEPKVPGRLQPLLEVMRSLRAHKFAPLFRHRPDVAEHPSYDSVVRQHMDLSIMRSRIEDGLYASTQEFFQDLLLMFDNAAAFYPRDSSEHNAAAVLREFAEAEMQAVWQTEALIRQETRSSRRQAQQSAPSLSSLPSAPTRSLSRKAGGGSGSGGKSGGRGDAATPPTPSPPVDLGAGLRRSSSGVGAFVKEVDAAPRGRRGGEGAAQLDSTRASADSRSGDKEPKGGKKSKPGDRSTPSSAAGTKSDSVTEGTVEEGGHDRSSGSAAPRSGGGDGIGHLSSKKVPGGPADKPGPPAGGTEKSKARKGGEKAAGRESSAEEKGANSGAEEKGSDKPKGVKRLKGKGGKFIKKEDKEKEDREAKESGPEKKKGSTSAGGDKKKEQPVEKKGSKTPALKGKVGGEAGQATHTGKKAEKGVDKVAEKKVSKGAKEKGKEQQQQQQQQQVKAAAAGGKPIVKGGKSGGETIEEAAGKGSVEEEAKEKEKERKRARDRERRERERLKKEAQKQKTEDAEEEKDGEVLFKTPKAKPASETAEDGGLPPRQPARRLSAPKTPEPDVKATLQSSAAIADANSAELDKALIGGSGSSVSGGGSARKRKK
eukprot:jgi/Mesen1/2428/ME000157S01574